MINRVNRTVSKGNQANKGNSVKVTTIYEVLR